MPENYKTQLRQSIIRMVNLLPAEQLEAIYDYTIATTKQLSREIQQSIYDFEEQLKKSGEKTDED